MNKQSNQGLTARDQLIENIFHILNDKKLDHQNTTLSRASIGSIGVRELGAIYRFLSQGIVQMDDNPSSQRPICPIGSIRQQNQATVGYKRSMLEYIKSFGLDLLATNPCIYTPGILERIANRCDIILQK